MEELEAEVDELREKNEILQREIAVLMEEKDRQLSAFEGKLEREKEIVEKEWKLKLKELDVQSRKELEAMASELDIMRSAFQGDASGWVVKKTKGGREYYENLETGETREDMPEVLYVAEAMQKAEKASELMEELEQLKTKFKDAEMRKREAETTVNKLRTEINHLREIERGWKETSRTMSKHLMSVVVSFDHEADKIISGVHEVGNEALKVTSFAPSVRKVTQYIAKLKSKISSQEEKISQLNSANRRLQNELDDALAKVKRLSTGIEEEVERLVKPMREKVSDCMLQVMKEKAMRLQERRQLADLWPSTHLMPTILLQTRDLTEEEIQRRITRSREIEASKALMLEIRHNVSESRKWTVQYDEYGRQYFQHSHTGETCWEQPEIMTYKPPPGRDEMGNLTVTEDDLEKGWVMKCDYKGIVYYQSEQTHEITYEPPAAFRKIPPGRSPELFVGEAANIVLTFIKGKISKHVGILKRIKAKENGEVIQDETDEMKQEEEDYKFNTKEDLTKFLYDIETVEALAEVFEKNILATKAKTKEKGKDDGIREIFLDERKKVLDDYEANVGLLENEGVNCKREHYLGPTLVDVDVTEASFSQIKDIVQLYGAMEEKLERRLKELRVHLKDFSYVMVDMLDKKRQEKMQVMIEEQEKLAEKERVEKRMLQKQQTLKFRSLQRMATERGITMTDLENEMSEKKKEEGDEISSIGLGSQHEQIGVEESKGVGGGDDHSHHSHRSNDNEQRSGRSRTHSHDSKGLGSSVQQGSGMLSHRSNSRSPSPTIEKREYHSYELTEMPLVPDVSGDSVILVLGDPECGLEAAASDPAPRYSKEILETTNNLVNFSLFCGYNNLRMDQIPDDLTHEITNHDESYLNEDDHWLTASFYLNITKEHIDGIREATQKVFDPILHSLDSKPLNSLKLVYEAMNMKNHETHQPDDPYTPHVTFTHNGLRREHALWKSRQIMAEILRYQLQQEAMKESYNRQEEHVKFLQQKQFFLAPNPTDTQNNNILADLRVVDVIGENINFEGASGRHYAYVRFTVGTWTTRTVKQHLSNRKLEWNDLNVVLTLPKLRLETDMIRVELFDEYEFRADLLVGYGTAKLSQLTGKNMGTPTVMEFEIYDNYQVYSGKLLITFIADLRNDITAESLHSSVADERNHLALNHMIGASHSTTQTMSIELATANDNLSLAYPSLIDTQTEFSSLVDDLRGDGHDHVKRLVGDIQVEDVLKLGHRIVLNSMKKLPNFKIANNFLLTKSRMHYHDMNDFINETNEFYGQIEKEIQDKIIEINKNREESSLKYQQMLTKNQDILEDVKRINVKLSEVREPSAKPKEPIFEPFPDLPYVPELPKTTGLDSKGKKKKDLKGSEVKTLITQIENKEMDGKTVWDFGERWPTNAQFALLKQAADKRNSQLDEDRAKEQAARDQTIEIYTQAYQRWEIDDRYRRNEYEKLKKESRKIYLRYDCMNERQEILRKEVAGFEDELKLWNELNDFHFQSKDKIKIIRSKLYFEMIRQKEYLQQIRQKLLLLIDARRRSYDIPLSARNEIEYELYCEKASIALRTLRFEIIDCKENLVQEGIRLRRMYEEEYNYIQNELIRCKVMKELLNQKIGIDHILKRHHYEVYILLEDLEKLKLYEADRDDRGIEDTVDGLGERYCFGKEWVSPDITRLNGMITVIMNKINLTNAIKTSFFNSQKNVFQMINYRYQTEMTPVRDSWCENSDYERGLRQKEELIQWIILQKELMKERERQYELIKERAQIELVAYQDYMTVSKQCHETETNLITESSKSVIDIMKEEIVQKEKDYNHKITILEKNVSELSKECHELREDKYKQALSYNTKVDSLLSLVATLQTTLEHQTAVMELVKEERDAIVLKTRLASDRLKYQLRLERKHSANLLFIIHAQRAVIQRLHVTINSCHLNLEEREKEWKAEKRQLRLENWEQLYVFSYLNTNIDDLFEFFITRIANLAGGRKDINEKLRQNGAAMILSAFCHSPRPSIRKFATKALGSYGWDGYTETRIILWDSMIYWKNYKTKILSQDMSRYDSMKEHFLESGNITILADMNQLDEKDTSTTPTPNPEVGEEAEEGEYKPLPNASIRNIIKQKRQWALRKQRRKEGPNFQNMKTMNLSDGVVQTLVKVCQEDGKVDWEIVRNASLALSVASFEESNLIEMANHTLCVDLIIKLLTESDPEIQTHAATVLANLCFENEKAQLLFGKENAVAILINLCRQTTVPDLLQAITAGLTNMTCLCDSNCLKFLEGNGVQEMVALLTTIKGENFLDTDQFDEIQANASEILANISRFDCELTVRYFTTHVIDVLILSCASSNKMVKKHSPLIIGNISQSDWCRREIGKRGGIEALFLGLEDSDRTIQGNILWALCNLMWFPPNQERAGRFIPEIIPFLSNKWLPVQTNAAILIANVLYYNNPNRVRFLEYEGSMELLIGLIQKRSDWVVVEACLRAVLSLSYIDAASLWLGTEGNCLPLFLEFLQPPIISNESYCSKYSLEILNNMCVHHTIRKMILDLGGTDSVVTMLAHDDISVQQTASKVLELLEDVTPLEVLTKVKGQIPLERLIILLSSEDPLVRAMSAESIGEEIWKDARKQNVVNELRGIESLLSICKNSTESVHSILPALWSLRNCLNDNPVGKDQYHQYDGNRIILSVLTRGIMNEFGEQSDKVFESILLLFLTVITNHEHNSRRLLQIGLDILLDISEDKLSSSLGVSIDIRKFLSAPSLISLARTILSMLGPYNYVVCKNCQKKQNLSASTHCISCGYMFYVDMSLEGIQSPGQSPHTYYLETQGLTKGGKIGSKSAFKTGLSTASGYPLGSGTGKLSSNTKLNPIIGTGKYEKSKVKSNVSYSQTR